MGNGNHAGRKGKYGSVIVPRFDYIKHELAIGNTEKSIAESLGVSSRAWERYKVNHPEFADLITNSRIPVIQELENAMYKAACGYEQVVKRPVKVRNTIYDPQTGKKVQEVEEVVYSEETLYFKPDVAAGMFLLCNWQRDRYSRDPSLTKIREEELKLKKDNQW